MERCAIAAAALDALVAHARREAPLECCGLLVGGGNVIERAVPTSNAASSPRTRYRIDPVHHFRLIRELRGTERQILGAYHSHPSAPSAPSPRDIAEAWPAPFVYLIVSLENEAEPDVRAYRVNGGNVFPVALLVDGP